MSENFFLTILKPRIDNMKNKYTLPGNSHTSQLDAIGHLYDAIKDKIIGQDALIRDVITALFSGGHILIEGMPGLGKTQLAKAIARSLGTDLSRIQCTPDLSPADITGTEILITSDISEKHLKFINGPIFSSIVLVDEINRATPKTQSALLEAMQENQVTYSGIQHKLPSPFIVVATQNPIELEGTYPLPEAQLDRFFSKLIVDLPDENTWTELANELSDTDLSSTIKPVLSLDDFINTREELQNIIIADPVRDAAVKLILSTHPRYNHDINKHIRYGISPRGLQAVLKAARVNAVLNNRVNVSIDDIRHVSPPVLRHRLILTLDAEIDSITPDMILSSIIDSWLNML